MEMHSCYTGTVVACGPSIQVVLGIFIPSQVNSAVLLICEKSFSEALQNSGK